jgi:hypothetical protein
MTRDTARTAAAAAVGSGAAPAPGQAAMTLVTVRPQLDRSPCLGAFGEAADGTVVKPLG